MSGQARPIKSKLVFHSASPVAIVDHRQFVPPDNPENDNIAVLVTCRDDNWLAVKDWVWFIWRDDVLYHVAEYSDTSGSGVVGGVVDLNDDKKLIVGAIREFF